MVWLGKIERDVQDLATALFGRTVFSWAVDKG